MKKIAVFLVLMLVLSGIAFAFQNEPEGFRKLNWGNTPTSTMEFVQDMDEMMKIYQDPTEENSIGSVSFYQIFYSFYVDELENLRFSGVTLFYNSESFFDALDSLCSGKFGPATDEGYHRFYWEGMITTIHLSYDSVKEKGWLSISSTRLWDKYLKRKEAKELAEAENDW